MSKRRFDPTAEAVTPDPQPVERTAQIGANAPIASEPPADPGVQWLVLRVPLGPPVDGYQARAHQLNLNLHPRRCGPLVAGLHALLGGLVAQGACCTSLVDTSGRNCTRPVATVADAARWLLERIAEASEAEAAP